MGKIPSALIVFLIILVIISFFIIFKPVSIIGSAMEPGYKNGERYLSNKLAYAFSEPKRGDVVIYYFPQYEKYLYIGRVVGLPGESLKIQGGIVTINGKPLVDEHLASGVITETMNKREITGSGKLEEAEGLKIFEEGQEIILPNENYFIMGDNRSESIDSRSLGFVNQDGIIGKLSLKY